MKCIIIVACCSILGTLEALSLTPRRNTSPAVAVAVIGTTGRLGRHAVQQLSQRGVASQCLVRSLPPPFTRIPVSLDNATTKFEVLAYLQTLPGVQLIQGDVTNRTSLDALLDGTSSCLALYGARAPRPWFKAIVFPRVLYPASDLSHPYQVNYVGVQHVVERMMASSTCRHLVRVTGNGETPWSLFSILINALSGMAKGWNYEAEAYIRSTCTIDRGLSYTILRPGVMTDSIPTHANTLLGVADNGRALPVTAVRYADIAALAMDVTTRVQCQRSTLTAMMVENANENPYTLEKVQPDTRTTFPSSLIREHQRAARVGGLVMVTIATLLVGAALSLGRWLVTILATKFG